MEHMDSSRDSMPPISLLPSDKRRLWHTVQWRWAVTCLAFNWCSAAELQSCTQVAHLICTGCRGINTSLSYPTMFAHAWVCSAVSLSSIVMSNSLSTFPPCPSAASCPSSSLSLLSASPSLPLTASGLTVHLPTHTHSVCPPSWNCLSECINIYLPSCPVSPVNTLLSLWNAIVTSYFRGPFKPKVTAEAESVSVSTTPLPRLLGDLGFCVRRPLG